MTNEIAIRSTSSSVMSSLVRSLELRRPRRLMRRDRLGVLDRATVVEVRRDAGCAEGGQEVEEGSPASSARRLIIRSTSCRAMGFSVSCRVRDMEVREREFSFFEPLFLKYVIL